MVFKEVLQAIRLQSGFEISSSSDVVELAAPVTISAQDMPIEDFLHLLMADQPLQYKMEGKTIVLSKKPSAVASEVVSKPSLVLALPEVRGRVVDSLGNPLAGATVRVLDASGRRTALAATTDQDGSFLLRNVPEEARLEISFVGYVRQIVAIRAADVGIVALEALPSALEEVEVMVNTGYQLIPKERATGSFDHIDRAALQTRTGTNILSRIEGLVPGLQFDNRRDGDTRINIRGINTFYTSMMEPLIVLDNFPYHGNIENINPNDIESVTVLKDAAAASIWGAQAGNGVIVITTRRAKELDQIKVTYTSNFSIEEKPDLFYGSSMTSSDFIDVERFLFEKGHYNNAYNGVPRTKNNAVFSPVVDMLFKEKVGKIDKVSLEEAIQAYRQNDYRTEMLDLFYRKPFHQQYHVGVSSRSRSMANRVSVGYDAVGGSQAGSITGRFTLQSVSTLNLGKKLSVEGRVAYARSQRDQYMDMMSANYSIGGGKSNLYPYARFRDDEGRSLAIPRQYNFEYVQSLQNTPLLDWLYYPFEDIGKAVSSSYQNHLQTQLKLDYKAWDGLNLSLHSSFTEEPGTQDVVYSEESFYTRNLINRFTQLTGNTVKYIVPLGAIKKTDFDLMRAYNLRGQASYHKQFGDDHQLDALLGGEFSHRRSKSHGFWVHGYNEELMISQVVDPLGTYPVFDGLSGNSSIPNAGNSGFSSQTRRFISGYFNTGYTYKAKYSLTFSVRKDGSNLFGVKANDKWNPLWSSGISWALQRESFFQSYDWLEQLKVRATYGHSGNSGGEANVLPIIYYTNPSSAAVTKVPGAALSALSNPNLKWEDVRMFNLGVDFSFWRNALQGSIEYYDKKSTDLLSLDRLDITTGFASITRNVGKLDGTGVDLRLSGMYRLGVISSQSNLNLSYNKTVVSDFYGTAFRGSNYAANAGRSLNPVLGKALYPVFSYKFMGLDEANGDPRGLFNGEISKNYTQLLNDSLQNLTYHGSGLPPYYGTFLQSFTWKNLSLSFLIAYKFGHFYQRSTISYGTLFNSWRTHGDYIKRWQNPGDELFTTVPSMTYPAVTNRDLFYTSSDPNIVKGDLVRLQDVGMDYRKDFAAFNRLLKTTVFVKVHNAGILWKAVKENLDTDYQGMPPATRYSLGVNINL